MSFFDKVKARPRNCSAAPSRSTASPTATPRPRSRRGQRDGGRGRGGGARARGARAGRRRADRRALTADRARRAGDRPGRLPRRGPGLVRPLGRAALGRHARRRRPVPGGGRNGPSPARRRRRGALRPRRGGGAVIAVERGFALEDADGTLTPLAPVWSDPGVRMNEGGCDPDGRFWCGSMAYDQRPGAAALYRLDPDGSVRRVLERRHHLQRPGLEPRRVARPTTTTPPPTASTSSTTTGRPG